MRCILWAQGGGEAAAGDRRRDGDQGQVLWSDAAVMGHILWARGGGEAAAGERRLKPQ